MSMFDVLAMLGMFGAGWLWGYEYAADRASARLRGYRPQNPRPLDTLPESWGRNKPPARPMPQPPPPPPEK